MLNQNLETLDHGITLKSTDDLEKLATIANDRQLWRNLKQDLVEAAEASKSFDRDAKTHKSVSKSLI